MRDAESTIETSEEQDLLDSAADIPPGSTVERSEDGAITIIGTPEGQMLIEVDEDTELGDQLEEIAAYEGMTGSEALHDVITEFADSGGEPTDWP
ncbi:hypothetical protein [Halococcus sp. IIIV-5B]|uniref:hypothetical protein n=1 Tax=Halococcus sp. IIIV-5B TaxID=2321230 RepID=UPI000E76CAC4|nr:hypothetical protein [Halococcus sp. IIIV-5B]RJT07527.1 hypothetical protein D3261_02725 [Halococcus sp. IIIV-5B]